MVPAGNKAKLLSSVNHTTKTIRHHHHHHLQENWSLLFLIKLQALRAETLSKRDSKKAFFLKILLNFLEQLFLRTPANCSFC